MTNLYEKHRFRIDLDRPPMTKAELNALSNLIGSLKRSLTTVKNADAMRAKLEDKSEKPSNSGVLINAAGKCLALAVHWMCEGIEDLELARNHAREGKGQQAYNSKAAEPLSPEEEIAATVKRMNGEEVA